MVNLTEVLLGKYRIISHEGDHIFPLHCFQLDLKNKTKKLERYEI